MALHKARLASMLDNVQQICLTEQVPIAYTIDKFINDVKLIHHYTPNSLLVTPKVINEVREIRLIEQVSNSDGLKKCMSKLYFCSLIDK